MEYGLLLGTVALLVLLGAGTFGPSMLDWFTVLAGRITTT